MQGHPALWDEFQWERFLRMQERRHEAIMLYTIRARLPWRSALVWSEMAMDYLSDDEDVEGDEWKESTGYAQHGEDWKVISNPCYYHVSRSLESVRDNLHKLPNKKRTYGAVVDLIGHTHSIPTSLAAGIVLDLEYGFRGGAIAYCKRALCRANQLLDLLKELVGEHILSEERYLELARKCMDVRNRIGCYIVDLRNKVNG